MRAINHAMTGAVIGFVVPEPAIALPLAVVSHFICDALPHYDDNLANGNAQQIKKWVASPKFLNLLIADAGLCVLLAALLTFRHPLHWLLAAVCAFLAAAPDFMSLTRFREAQAGRTWQASGFTKFAERIQWFHRPIGAVVEIAWFTGCALLLVQFLG